jgi:aminoglycoside 6'-N-acetyltransferase
VTLRGEQVLLRPVTQADVAELRRIHATPAVARWWDRPEDDFPWEEPEVTPLVIEVGGAVAGLIQFGEELEPRYRHASVDIFLDPALHGRGLGTEAIVVLARHLTRERGHHRVTIDPSAANAAAIRAYEKAGFRAVGVMRRYERDVPTGEWRDGLLMDLLAEEL